MQDWDSRIKILKTNIQNAREKFVIPHLQVKEKSVPIPKEPSKILETIVGNEKKEDNTDENKIYENKDPLSSLELLNNEENMASDKSKTEPKLGLTEEITNKIDITLEKESKLEISAEVPKVDVTEVMETAEAPKVDVTEVIETAEAPKVDVTEVIETVEALKEETKIQISADKNIENLDEEGVKKTELELLEEKNENDLTEDEEDRMYELRRLRAQKAMNKEANEAVEADLKKADEEIAHLKSQLKPKEKKLPKGYIS